jgi:hypothetical protein
VQAQIRFRKLKEGFEEHIQELRDELKVVSEELREELQLLHLQTNNRLFFGTSHSVSRYATKLTSFSFPLLSSTPCYRAPTDIVGGGWFSEKLKVDTPFSQGGTGQLTWSEKWSIQNPKELFTLTDSDGVVNVKEVKNTC